MQQHPGDTPLPAMRSGGWDPCYCCSQMWGTWGTWGPHQLLDGARLEGAWGQIWVALGGLCQQRGLLLVCPEACLEPAQWDSLGGDIYSFPPCSGQNRARTLPWENRRLSRRERTGRESWQQVSPQMMFSCLFCSQKPPEFEFLNLLPLPARCPPAPINQLGGKKEKIKNNNPQTLPAKQFITPP